MYKTLAIIALILSVTSPAIVAEESPKPAPNLTLKQDSWDFTGNPGPVKQVYKWKDTEGTWHYSQSVPANGTAVTPVSTLSVDASTNIIKSMSDEQINQVLGKVDNIMKKRDQAKATNTASSSPKTGTPGCGPMFDVNMPEWMAVPLSVSCSDLELLREQLEAIREQREQYVKALDTIHNGG